MRPQYAALIAVFVLAAVTLAEPPREEYAQQNGLTQLAIDRGYEIGGMPQYNGTRWTMFAKVPGCKADVLLGGEEAAEEEVPYSFSVIRINNLSVKTEVLLKGNTPAEALKDIPATNAHLDC